MTIQKKRARVARFLHRGVAGAPAREGDGRLGFSRGCNQGEASPFILLILEQVPNFGEELFFGARCRRCCRSCGGFSFFLLAHVLHETEEFLHHEEDGECDDEEVQDFANEVAVRNGHAFSGLVGESLEAFPCFLATALGDDGGDERHHDVVHEGVNDFTEGGTDDDTDGHVDDVTLEGKCLEFFNE